MIPKQKAKRPQELFLSHASQDREFADRLVQILIAHRIPTWYSQNNLVPAQLWHDEIGRALKRCDWFMILLSPAALRSRWVRRELVYALRDDRFENRIIPILHQPCDHEQLSWTLPSFQFVDFTHGFKQGYCDLLKIWRLNYQSAKRINHRKPELYNIDTLSLPIFGALPA